MAYPMPNNDRWNVHPGDLLIKPPRKSWEKDFDEALHPRDDHGRFTDGGGGDSAPTTGSAPGTDRLSTPTTTVEARGLYIKDFKDYMQQEVDHGGPPTNTTPSAVYNGMNVVQARPEDVTPEQRQICEEAAAKFMNDPAMQPLFDEYGRPGVVVASALVSNSSDDAGSDPATNGVVAQWSNGTIFLYGDTAGEPSAGSVPGFSAAGADPYYSMQHEYGHQIMGVLGYDSNGDISNFRESFISALGDGVPFTDHMTVSQQEEFQSNVNMEAGSVSQYAESSPDEAFAEFFATMLQESGGDIKNWEPDNYDGGAAEAFQIIKDRILQDTAPPNTDQQTLFTRTNP